MKLSDLPDGHVVMVDTETSGTDVDSGARIAAVSLAYRVPDANGEVGPGAPLKRLAIPFDQGINNMPLGEKELDAATIKRLSKWPDWALDEDAENRGPDEFARLIGQLKRFRLVWHNAKFDMHMFRAGLRGRPDLGVDFQDETVWDTMTTQRVLAPQHPVALKDTAVRLHLGSELGVREGMEDDEKLALKPWLGTKKDARFDLVPWSVMGPYAGMDAALTLLLWEWQVGELEEHLACESPHVVREKDLMTVLYRMEMRGVGFDVETARRMCALLDAARGEVAARIPFKSAATGQPSPPAAAKYFFETLGRVPDRDKLTAKAQRPQVDDEVITRLAEDEWAGQAVAKLYQHHENIKSATVKWYKAWPELAGPDGRLRTNFKQTDVISGRLAVGRVQLQAIPHWYQLPKVDGLVSVRDLFVEDTKCPCGCGVMETWEFDVSQAEIRIATAMAQCVPMLEGIAKGMDSHTIATLLMFGDNFRSDGFEGREKEHPQFDQWRQVSKRCNLGILYGAGAKVILEQLKKFAGWDPGIRQVSKWIDDWKSAFPEMVTRQEQLEQMAINRGYVVLRNGRKRFFSSFEPLHKAFNQEIQGSLAEVMKDIMIEAENRYPDSLLLQIHDSLVMRLGRCQVEAGAKEDICALMSGQFEEAFAQRWRVSGEWVTVPFRSDAKKFGRGGEQ